MEDGFVFLALYGVVICLADIGMAVPEDVMVVAVGEFMQHHPGLGNGPFQKVAGVGDLDAAFFFRIEVVFD